MQLLKGDNIRLRPLETTDLDVLYEWENQVGDWFANGNMIPFSRFFLEQYIISAQHDLYADKQLRLIIEDHKGCQVGLIDLFDFEPHHKRAAIGILIAAPHQKKGYASEALAIMINYARKILNLHQLYCTIDHGNPYSRQLFEKNGFLCTGTRKQWNLRGRQWVDEDFFQLVFDPH